MGEVLMMSFTEELSEQLRNYVKDHSPITRQEVIRIALRMLFEKAKKDVA